MLFLIRNPTSYIMKKIPLLIVFLSLFYNLNAQFYAKAGIKAGGNYNMLMGDDLDNASSTFGFHMGGLIEMMINRRGNIFFQPEILYSMQGTKFDIGDDEFNSSEKINLHYLSVPLMTKIFINGYADEWFFEAGPYLNFLLLAKNNMKGTLNGTPIKEETNVSESYSATDLGLSFGFGHKFFDRTIFISARYNLGLTNINEFEDSNVNINNKNSVIQLSVGAIFN